MPVVLTLMPLPPILQCKVLNDVLVFFHKFYYIIKLTGHWFQQKPQQASKLAWMKSWSPTSLISVTKGFTLDLWFLFASVFLPHLQTSPEGCSWNKMLSLYCKHQFYSVFKKKKWKEAHKDYTETLLRSSKETGSLQAEENELLQ